MGKDVLAQVADFDLRLLRIFRTVAEHGSFAGAESALGISRSAISLHMGDLEKRLGMRLCQRGRAGFALTDEGREILTAAGTVLAAIENFRTGVNAMHSTLRGELNIGVMNNIVTLPHMRITRAIGRMRRLGEGLRVNISMSTPGEIERGVLDGRLHVGAVPLITRLSGLDYHPLYDERSSLYCGHEHPLFARAPRASAAELRRAPAVAPGYRMPREVVRLHETLNCTAAATDREGIAFLILTGEYLGFLPDHFAAYWVERGMMARLGPERMRFRIGMAAATRKGRRHNLILDRFMEFLLAEPA